MGIVIDSAPPTRIHNPKPRHLRGLIRHASAPARPHQLLEAPSSSESDQNMNKKRSSPSPRTAAISPRSKPNILSELSLSQSIASRLRLERDKLRTTAQIQERQILSNEREFKRQECAIAILEDQNAALRAGHEEGVSASNKLFARFQGIVAKHDKLVDQLNDAARTIAKLKKSDRAKGKVWQRNLRLKATLQRFSSHTTSNSPPVDPNVEAALQEALALANERIGELESTGEAMLEALDQRNDSCGGDNDEAVEDDIGFGILEAEVAFRGVLEDETFREQKEHWEYLLKE